MEAHDFSRVRLHYEQAGHEKAEYGSETLKRLSHDLSERYGKGFGMSNVNKMRKLYLTFPILQTLSAKLSWSHYVELLKIDDPQERSFYLHECEQENWGVRELKRQMIRSNGTGRALQYDDGNGMMSVLSDT